MCVFLLLTKIYNCVQLQAFFREKGPQSICEKRLQLMEELCQKLPESDPAHQTLETARKDVSEAREEIENTHQKLTQHQDKWNDYSKRCNDDAISQAAT